MKEFGATKTIKVPAQKGRAVKVSAGSLIAVIDVEGQQIGDMFAYAVDSPAEYLSAAHTRATCRRLFPKSGESFVTNRRRPILTMIEDTSPGCHDMLFAACDPPLYQRFGVQGWHPSCAENFAHAVKEFGHEFSFVPDPVDLFQNSPLEDGELMLYTAKSGPGDRVVFRAEMDLIFVLAACSSDVSPANGWKCTDLRIEISE
jgi:uncharacterized protein